MFHTYQIELEEGKSFHLIGTNHFFPYELWKKKHAHPDFENFERLDCVANEITGGSYAQILIDYARIILHHQDTVAALEGLFSTCRSKIHAVDELSTNDEAAYSFFKTIVFPDAADAIDGQELRSTLSLAEVDPKKLPIGVVYRMCNAFMSLNSIEHRILHACQKKDLVTLDPDLEKEFLRRHQENTNDLETVLTFLSTPSTAKNLKDVLQEVPEHHVLDPSSSQYNLETQTHLKLLEELTYIDPKDAETCAAYTKGYGIRAPSLSVSYVAGAFNTKNDEAGLDNRTYKWIRDTLLAKDILLRGKSLIMCGADHLRREGEERGLLDYCMDSLSGSHEDFWQSKGCRLLKILAISRWTGKEYQEIRK